MKRHIYIIACLGAVALFISSCDFIKSKIGGSQDDPPVEKVDTDTPKYDIAKTRSLLETAEEFALTDVQLNELIDQLDGLLKYVDARTNQVAAMPRGDDKCMAFDELKSSKEVTAVQLAFNTLNHGDRQAGYTPTIGRRILALKAVDRMKNIQLLADSIYAQCSTP